jgi:hypothetical protein
VERAAQDARARMADAKAAVRALGSRANASALQAAAGAEREAERLFKAGRMPEATAKFYEAGGLYRSAASGAAPAAPAPAPASVPSAVPSPSTTTPPPPPPDTPLERPSSSLPLPTGPVPAPPPSVAPPPAPVTTPALPPSSPVAPAEDLIKEVLSKYEAALEGRNLDAIKRLWPSLGETQQSAMQKEFQHASRIDVTLSTPQITVSGNTATATFTRRYQLQTTEGSRLQTDNRTTMTLRHTNAGWFIDQIRFEAPR